MKTSKVNTNSLGITTEDLEIADSALNDIIADVVKRYPNSDTHVVSIITTVLIQKLIRIVAAVGSSDQDRTLKAMQDYLAEGVAEHQLDQVYADKKDLN